VVDVEILVTNYGTKQIRLLRHGHGLSTESNIRHSLLVNNHYRNMHSHIAILEVACELTGLVLTVQLDPDISLSADELCA
jgi:CO dehydrogenase nickel-insertion accessory protein CooC1